MSSSNRCRVTLIPESTYGETPVAGNFSTARFVSEALSGTPETTESQTIRTDRQSSGQVVTNLTVGGAVNMELAKDPVIDSLLQSAMYSTWVTPALVTVGLSLNATANTLTRDAGDFAVGVRVGDFLTLSGFTTTANNTQVLVTSINSALEIGIIGDGLVTDATGTGFKVLDNLSIGTTINSFSMEKAFLDLTTKAINYKGQIVSVVALDVTHGSIVTSNFTFMGNDYEPVSASGDFMTNGRTISAPATTNSLNGSVDMPFVASNVNSVNMTEADFCINGVKLSINNNLYARNCIGLAAPKSYGEGVAQISVSINAYLGDTSWSMLAKKLSQASFSLAFILKNAGGSYAFYLPAIQVTFDDPASAGQNQDVMIDMNGVGKVGSSGESALRIYKA